MPNINAPRGLVPVQGAYSQPYNAGVRLYYHDAADANAIGIGDLVTSTGASTFYNQSGIVQSLQNVVRSVSGDVFQGVCVGVLQTNRDSPIYVPGSNGLAIFVMDDPNALFMMQESNAGTALTANDIGLNANISVAAPNAFTGLSNMLLDNATEATTATLDLKIMGQYQAVDNDLGNTAALGAVAGRWIVRINRHRLANQVAGV